MRFMKQIFIFLAFVLIVGFLTFHDKKKDYAEIGKTNFTSYVERVDGCKKVGICDSMGVVFRDAKYYSVEEKAGYIVAYYYDNSSIDLFTVSGDSILPEVKKSSVIFCENGSEPYFSIEDEDGKAYVLLAESGKVIGPCQNFKIVYGKHAIMYQQNLSWGMYSFDGMKILPNEYSQVIFVTEKINTLIKKRKSVVTEEYLLAGNGVEWQKFSNNGDLMGEVSKEIVDSIKKQPSFESVARDVAYSVDFEH